MRHRPSTSNRHHVLINEVAPLEDRIDSPAELQDAVEQTFAQRLKRLRSVIPSWLRPWLRVLYILEGFVLLVPISSLIGYILMHGFGDLAVEASDQVAFLMSICKQHPVISSLLIAIVLAFYGFGVIGFYEDFQAIEANRKKKRIIHNELVHDCPDRLIGQGKVVRAIIAQVRRPNRGGVLLRGEAGIGKTAIAAVIAKKMSKHSSRAFPGGVIALSCPHTNPQADWDGIMQKLAIAFKEKLFTHCTPQNISMSQVDDPFQRAISRRTLIILDGLTLDTAQEIDLVRKIASCGAIALTLRAPTDESAYHDEELSVYQVVRNIPKLALDESLKLFRYFCALYSIDIPLKDEQIKGMFGVIEGGVPVNIRDAAYYISILGIPIGQAIQDARLYTTNSGLLRNWVRRIETQWQVLSKEQQYLFAGLSLLDGESFSYELASWLGEVAIQLDKGSLIESQAVIESVASNAKQHSLALRDGLCQLGLLTPVALKSGRFLRLVSNNQQFAHERLNLFGNNIRLPMGHAIVDYCLYTVNRTDRQFDAASLESESSCLNFAMEFARDNGRDVDFLTLVRELAPYWKDAGNIIALNTSLRYALAATSAIQAAVSVSLESQIIAAHTLALLYTELGNDERASYCLAAAHDLVQATSDDIERCLALHLLGMSLEQVHLLPQAWEAFHEALELATRENDQSRQAIEYHSMGIIDVRQAELMLQQARGRLWLPHQGLRHDQRKFSERAHEELRVAYKLAIEELDNESIAHILWWQGYLAVVDDNRNDAVQLFNEALSLYTLLDPYRNEVIITERWLHKLRSKV